MAIKLDCPRCNKPLSIPSKKIGRYVNCPRCSGRFWVPENAADSAPEVDPNAATAGPADAEPVSRIPPQPPDPSAGLASMGGATSGPSGGVVAEPAAGQNTPAARDTAPLPPVSGSGSGWQMVSPQPAAVPAPAPTPAGTPPAPPVTPPVPAGRGGSKTARFVSAEAAQSSLKLEEDGKLPELLLREDQQKEKRERKSSSLNPLVLLGLLSLSVAASIGVALVDVEPVRNQGTGSVRQTIEESFFPREGMSPLGYQEYLMRAQRAHTRGDFPLERKLYAEVLDLLRQEVPDYVGQLPKGSPEYKEEEKKRSVTGTWTRDRELEELISAVLSND